MSKEYNREELTEGEGPFDVWTKLPTKPGQRLQGLSRSAVYIGIDSGKIKTACIKQPGKLTGSRLVWLPSVIAYIESFVEKPEVK